MVKRIDLNKENISKNTNSIDVYQNGQFIGRYNLDRPEAITELNVKELIDSEKHYLVPAYQRGYRWTSKQVEELLTDIWNWNEDAKYSLQPIVISQRDDLKMELVDGQQRLTTIYIILRAASPQDPQEINYTIDYETRDNTSEFLKNKLNDEVEASKNIDWYHMHKCYLTAKDYFSKLAETDANVGPKDWVKKLTDDDTGAFFIQYQILKEIDTRKVEQIFTGLNAGKIPLTNSELVKALVLKEKNFQTETYQNEFVEIAREWDRIEKRLQEPNFWSWLGQDTNDDSPHIDFVLTIVADIIKSSSNGSIRIEKKSYQELYSYNVISRYLNSKDHTVTDFWHQVEQCFMTLEDWYSDNKDYHLVGYLSITNQNKAIVEDLYIEYLESSATDSDILKQKIAKIDFNDVYYGTSIVNDTLLLFNIVTCINTRSRFRFDEYVNGNYDVEHISPHSGFDDIKRKTERVSWIQAIQNSGLSVFSKLDMVDAEKEADDPERFNKFYRQVIELTSESTWQPENLDRLGNLCLLDSETNRSYGNKPFPLKLQEIVKVDKTQIRYLLPTTKNVFLKYYSELNVNNLTWNENDAINYEDVIKSTLNEFFGWENNDDEK